MLNEVRYSFTDIARATIKATVSTVPAIGPYLSEFVSLTKETLDRSLMEARLRFIENQLEGNKRFEECADFVYSNNLDSVLKILDAYYFDCGASHIRGVEVFVCSWYSGADHGYNNLNANDKLAFLVQILVQCRSADAEAEGEGGGYASSEDFNSKILKIAAHELSVIPTDFINDDLIARVFMLYAQRLINSRNYQSAILSLLKAIEHAALGRLKNIKYPYVALVNGKLHSRGAVAESFEMHHLFLLLSQLYVAVSHTVLAKQAVKILLKLVEHLPPHDYYWTFKAAEVLVSAGAREDAVATFEQFLNNSRELVLTDPQYKDSTDLWSKREYASYFVMENKIPILPRDILCLCASSLTYAECCADLLENI